MRERTHTRTVGRSTCLKIDEHSCERYIEQMTYFEYHIDQTRWHFSHAHTPPVLSTKIGRDEAERAGGRREEDGRRITGKSGNWLVDLHADRRYQNWQ